MAVEVKLVRSKHGPTYKAVISGDVRGVPVSGESLSAHLAFEKPDADLVYSILPDYAIRRKGGGAPLSTFARMQIRKAVLAAFDELGTATPNARRYSGAYYIVRLDKGKVVDGPFSRAEGDAILSDKYNHKTHQLIQGMWMTEAAYDPWATPNKATPNARRTFKVALREILDYLGNQGWAVAPNLKVPHATSPFGDIRLWFKPQAIYIEKGKPFHLGSARSLHVDSRDVDPEGLESYALSYYS
jgi:hypothetical protein